MTNPLPTYSQALLAPTVAAEAADLLSRFPPTIVAGWSPDAPQRQMVDAEAQALQFEMVQRVLIAMTASPTKILQIAAWLQTQGYSADDAATIQSTWVDVFLEWYQIPNGTGGVGRIQATRAIWAVPLIATSTQTIDANSNIVLQADDGTFFVLLGGATVYLNAGDSYQAGVSFQARDPGTGGNVTPGTISQVVQGPAGLSINTGTQTNIIPARDTETDAAAVARAMARWATLGAGWTDTSFDYLIPLFATTVTRWYVDSSNPLGPGSVAVYLADATGPASGPQTQPATECYAVAQGLGASNVRPFGSGVVGVFSAPAYNDTITVTVKGDGSNQNLSANITSALNSLTAQLPMGPLYVTAEFLIDVCTGRAFSGTTAFQTLAGTYKELPFVLPGFGGAVGVVSVSTSQGLSGGGSGPYAADVMPAGHVFVATPAVTVT